MSPADPFCIEIAPPEGNIILMFENRIIQKIIETWSIDQAHPLRERIRSPLPPFEQIKRVIETAYLASLEREEGRPVRFALVVVDPAVGDKISTMRRPPDYLLHLETPLPLSQPPVRFLHIRIHDLCPTVITSCRCEGISTSRFPLQDRGSRSPLTSVRGGIDPLCIQIHFRPARLFFISALFRHLPALKSLLSLLDACEEVPFGGR